MHKEINNLKKILNEQSRIAIELDVSETINKQVYNSEDLLNATQIFMHILGNVSIGYGISRGLNEEQLSMIAEEMGKNLKQTIFLSTGIDVPSLVRRLYQ